jgi:hypothetical protein
MNRPWEEDAFNVEEIREYIGKLSDKDLLRYGRAARYMTTPEATQGEPPARCFWSSWKSAERNGSAGGKL